MTLAAIIVFHLLTGSLPDSAVSAEPLDNLELVRLLNDAKLLQEIRADEISVRIWELGDSPGSAGQASGEVTTSLFLAVSEYGEYPTQKVFRLTSLFGPRIQTVTHANDSVTITFSFIDNKTLEAKQFIAVVTLESVDIKQ